MATTLPQEVSAIYKKLIDAGFSTYLVGGSVRNILLNKPVKDWDMTTIATPEHMLQLFPGAFYDNAFGTVGIPVEKGVTRVHSQQNAESQDEHGAESSDGGMNKRQDLKQIVEVTTFRTEKAYTDNRHPDKVVWGKTIEEDLQRRDFTMNAIAMQIPVTALDKDLLIHGALIDPFNGQEDLKNHIIRAVGDPTRRFKEDALRLMRAIRFATQLSFTIEEKTWQSIQEDATSLASISGERIRDELLKILASDFPYEGIMLLKNAGLLQYILPELLDGIGISQARPGRHHVYDVFEHNLLSLKFCPSKDPIVRFATLIHDIGKPQVASADADGLVIFYNHEVKGAQIAYEICNRLHFSKKEREKIVKLIRWHMFTVDEHITDSAVRRFIRRIGVENVRDLLDVRVGDRLGSGIPEERKESWRMKKFWQRLEKELQPAPFSINDLAIDGNDIMQELQIQPGPIIGKLLQQLFEETDEDLSQNTKSYLLEKLHKIYKK